MTPHDATRKVAIVSGGATGIGGATSVSLANAGWSVYALGRRRSALDAIERDHVVGVVCDVSDRSHVIDAVVKVQEIEGRIDGLVLNAGITRAAPLGESDQALWDETIGINLSGAYYLAHACLDSLLRNSGSVVSVSSVAGLRAAPGAAAYSISKAALLMLSHSLAVDYGPQGLRSNAVCPGWTRSEMADREMAEFGQGVGLDLEAAYEEITRLVPQRRPASSEEVAQVICWLLSESASYVNGATISVDGGLAVLDAGTTGLDFSIKPRV